MTLYLRILRYLSPHRGLFVLSIVSMTLYAALERINAGEQRVAAEIGQDDRLLERHVDADPVGEPAQYGPSRLVTRCVREARPILLEHVDDDKALLESLIEEEARLDKRLAKVSKRRRQVNRRLAA